MTQPISSTSRFMPRRIAISGAILLLGFGSVWARLYHLQCRRHNEICRRVEEMHRQQRPIPAHRGSIWDRNGELLAQDRTTHDLYADTLQLRDIPMVRVRLGHIEKTSALDLSRHNTPEEIVARYRRHVAGVIADALTHDNDSKAVKAGELERLLTDEKRVEFVLIKGLQDEEAATLRQIIEEQNIIGVNIHSGTRRFYPAAERLTHVLGFVNSQNEGQGGIESTLNTRLKGVDGHQWIERDRKGREITTFRGETVEPQHGQEIVLTIDMQLQEIMEQTLEEAFEFYHPRKIVAVLVEPATGAIRAMASRPHFERSDMEGTQNNLAVGTHYEPGSVFKIVAYSGVFDRGLASLEETINVDGEQKVFAGLNIHDHLNSRITVATAFAKSSNRGAYLLAHRLGDNSFLDYVKRFGFGQKTGIPLTGEVGGIVMPHKTWDNLTYSRMAIGHAITVTPLQMAMAVSAIANGGNLMKPQLVEEIRDDKGRVLDHLKG
ncbi:MAG: penicillin-binding protein 2, partial [Verrucomicrobiaceae bacterium]